MTTAQQELNGKNVQNICRLSPMQEGIYFHAIMEEGSGAYFCQNAYRVRLPLQYALLERSLQLVMRRHDILRTVFSHRKTEDIVQIILKDRRPVIAFEDISKTESQETYLAGAKLRDRHRGFDLAKDVLLRLSVFRLNEQEYELVWSHHHIIMDGWCSGMLMREFTGTYQTLAAGRQPAQARAPQFGAYIDWVQQQDPAAAEGYWRSYVDGFVQPTGLPRQSTATGPAKHFEEITWAMPQELSQQLARCASQRRLTLNTVLQAAWGVLLARINDTGDVVFGAVSSVRPAAVQGIEQMLGLFINTLPIRLRCSATDSLLSVAETVQRAAADAAAFQYYPLHRIQQLSAVRDQLIDHVFIMENFGSAFENGSDGAEQSVRFSDTFSQTNYDLNIVVLPGQQTVIRFNYNAAVYRAGYIRGISRMLGAILEQFVSDAAACVRDLRLTPAGEAAQLLLTGTGDAQPWRGTIYEQFERQACLHPSAIAVRMADGEELTYAQLQKKVRNLSRILSACGCAKGTAVGVHTGNSIHTVTGLLAILHAGGVYVPLDANLPPQRIAHIIGDAGITMILVRQGEHTLPPFDGTLIQADTDYDCPCMEDTSCIMQRTDTAYIIYTSGTTGLPKGVPVRHESIADRITYHNDYLGISGSDKVLQFAAIAFDASLVEIFMALTSGATLVLVPPACKENIALLRQVIEGGVTTAIFPPAYLKLIDPAGLPSLRRIISTGEAAILHDVLAHAAHRTVINGYGPTESCVGASFHTVQPSLQQQYVSRGALPIGKPFSHTRIYVCDAQRQLVPQGVTGEICIAGPGISAGYLHREELTRQKFVANPFASEPGYERIYLTGDAGHWNGQGELEYEGRIDQQVQISGIRVEPGEVEKLLLQHPQVKDALVVPHQTAQETKLLAYVVLRSAAAGDGDESFRNYLQQFVPLYMLPWKFMRLDSIPLTANGKADRSSLPLPETTSLPPASAVEASTPQEHALLRALRTLVRKDIISTADHFLELGGDSIKAIQLVSALHRQGWKLELKEVFRHAVLRDMALQLQPLSQLADQGVAEGATPLGAIQAEFFARGLRFHHHFNQSILLKSRDRLNAGALLAVMQKITAHHDALRMVFLQEDGAVRQYNKGLGSEVAIEEADFSRCDNAAVQLAAHAQQLQESFVLAEGPLLKACIYRMPDGDRLLLVAHHLVVDGVSWRILLEDIGALYEQAISHRALELPPKTDSFQRWAKSMHAAAAGEAVLAQWPYWAAQAPSENYFEHTGLAPQTAATTVELDEPLTALLVSGIHRAYNTEVNDILLAAAADAFSKQWQGRPLVLALESHGRGTLEDVDVSRTVGWFTNVYPVSLSTSHGMETGMHIRTVKEQLRNVPGGGAGYGMLRYIAQHPALASTPEPQILFNYLGQLDGEAERSGFGLATEHTGNNTSEAEKILYPLVITVLVLHGRLKVTLRYDQGRVDGQTAQSLCRQLQNSLTTIIQHCAARTEPLLSPSDLVAPVATIAQLDAIAAKYKRLCHAAVSDVYPLSPMQEGMLFHELVASGSGAYIYQVNYRLRGHVDPAMAERAANELVARHDILRTVFHFRDTPRLLQVVLSERKVHFTYHTLASAQLLDDFLAQGKTTAFDLEKDELFRLALVQLPGDEFAFVWTCHHILMDGWCMAILLNEFRELYVAHSAARTPQLAPPAPFREYIRWLQRFDNGQALEYWTKYLEGYGTPVVLQHRQQEPVAAGAYDPGHCTRSMNAVQTGLLKELGYQCGATPYDCLQAIWGVLLSKYNHSRDVVFGSIVSGRPPAVQGIERMLGLFVNLVPVRVQYSDTTLFSNLVAAIRQQASESADYHYCSLAQVQSRTALKTYPINHFIELENYPVSLGTVQQAGEHNWQVSGIEGQEHTSYDLCFVINLGEGAAFSIHYNRNVYDDAAMQQLLEHFLHLLRQVLADRWISIDKLSLNDDAARQQLLQWSKGGDRDYPVQQGFVQLFAGRVGRHPGSMAVCDRQERWTYGELWERSLAIAARLKNIHGIRREEVVGICMDRSAWMVASVIGTWMAGAAYLPLDPALPQERLHYMAADAGVRLLLLHKAGKDDFTDFECMNVDEAHACAADGLPEMLDAHSLSYVIYTSGSTGKPKGVMIEQGGMLNHLFAKIEDLGIGEDARIAQTAAIGFDISVWQLVCAPLAGAAVRVFSHYEVLQATEMLQAVSHEKITHWQVSPVYLSELLSAMESTGGLPSLASLRCMIVTGEALKPGLVKRWFACCPSIPLVNAYGPTEASDDITHAFIYETPAGNSIPIGKPLNNLQVYVTDLAGDLCPAGIPGEISVGGIGVGRGYVGTGNAGKFIEEPFHLSHRIYKTGDWGWWSADGQLLFSGRKDDQVKINGHRIELGEIENVLSAAPGIAEAAVINGKEKDRPGIIAYIQWLPGHEADLPALKAWLKRRLTDYMVPATFVAVDRFAVTANGKLDRKRLPDPQPQEIKETAPAAQAASEKETALLQVWQQVLGSPAITVHDDFFECGGDSIRAIQITSRLYSKGYRLEVQHIFDAPTIAQLAAHLQPLAQEIDQSKLTGLVPLTPVQHRFFAMGLRHPHHYNQSVMLSFRERLDPAAVQQLFAALCEHHDALRMQFIQDENGTVLQSVGDSFTPAISVFNWQDRQGFREDLLLACNRVQSSFSLDKGCLVQLALFSLPEEDCLLIVLHHLVTDGVSWRILLEDLTTLFTQQRSGQPLQLPLKTSSFRDWSEALLQYSGSHQLQQEKKYWHAQLRRQGGKFLTAAPAAEQRINDLSIKFSRQETTQLLKEAHGAFGTDISDLLLTAMGRALREVFGMEQCFIDLERHGREHLTPSLNLGRTVGWFTSIFPFHLDVSGSDGLAEQLKSVKEAVRSIPRNGIGYGMLRYLVNDPQLQDSHPEIVFNYLGQFDQEIDDAICTAAPYGTGSNADTTGARTHVLNIGAIITRGILSIQAAYDERILPPAAMNAFAEAYRQQLLSLADYCIQYTETVKTASDYGYADITSDDLSMINNLFN